MDLDTRPIAVFAWQPYIADVALTFHRKEPSMRRRLIYVLPDPASARKMMDDLLLARIEERHIHFVANPEVSMLGLHEASLLQKSDLVHGAQVGMLLGAALGCAAGVAIA